jgi:ketosteroid isomerase-like protein
MAMASSEAREALARRGFEAFNAADLNAIMDLLAEDVEVFSSPELANPGTFHGHEGYLTWIRPWNEAWQGLEMEVVATTPVGDRHVAAEVHQTGHGRAGIEVTMDVAFLFDVNDDGLATFLALLPDREQAIAMARDREASG